MHVFTNRRTYSVRNIQIQTSSCFHHEKKTSVALILFPFSLLLFKKIFPHLYEFPVYFHTIFSLALKCSPVKCQTSLQMSLIEWKFFISIRLLPPLTRCNAMWPHICYATSFIWWIFIQVTGQNCSSSHCQQQEDIVLAWRTVFQLQRLKLVGISATIPEVGVEEIGQICWSQQLPSLSTK